jgi:glycopeptide antibiotics resistance protein
MQLNNISNGVERVQNFEKVSDLLTVILGTLTIFLVWLLYRILGRKYLLMKEEKKKKKRKKKH